MRLAVAQIDTSGKVPGDAARRLLNSAQLAADAGAELMVCPYATVFHPISPDMADQIDYAVEMTETIALLSREAPCPLLVCGGIDVSGYSGNLAFYIHDGAVEPVAVGSLNAGEYGPAATISCGGVSFAVANSREDLDWLIEEKTKADVVVFASAHSFCVPDPLSAMGSGFSEGVLSTIAQDADVWLVGAASLGGYGEDVYCGASFVVTPWGELAAHSPAFEESLFMYDLDLHTEGPLAAPAEPDYFDRSLMMWLALSLGLTDLLRAEGMQDVALALDGSLDSLACCVLASDALGPRHVHVLMPSSNDDASAGYARELAEALGVIQHEPSTALTQAAQTTSEKESIVQIELAGLARELGALVLMTQDKTALALEADKLGLCAGWLAPLGDVYRLDLVELVRLRNTISPIIPRECLRNLELPQIEGIDVVASTAHARLEYVDMVIMSRIEAARSCSEIAKSYGHPELVEALATRLCDMAPYRRGVHVFRVSSRALNDMVVPLGLSWRSSVHEKSTEGRLESIMTSLLAKEQQVSLEPQVQEMLGILQDLIETNTAPTPRQPPFGWNMPFSEN